MRSWACLPECTLYACEKSQWDFGSFLKCVRRIGFWRRKKRVKVVFRNDIGGVGYGSLCVNIERKADLSRNTLASLSPNSAALFHLRDFQKDFELTIAQSEMLCVWRKVEKNERALKGRPVPVVFFFWFCFLGMKFSSLCLYLGALLPSAVSSRYCTSEWVSLQFF